ncbi:MAG: AsmA-like C-terminal domain-containing protein [Sulfurimonas sp.]|nr:AsmA-like C-terminal domain-containing protein [Sulfurimonas sp.]
MTDKIIINTISKTHFILVSFISFIFLVLLSLFIILQNGLYIEKISIANVTAKQLYIKWNEKLDLSLKELEITKTQNSATRLEYKKIHGYFSKLPLFNNAFENIIINKITIGDVGGSFSYIKHQNGFLKLSSSEFLLESCFYFEPNTFNIEIQKFHDIHRKIDINGTLVLDLSVIDINAVMNIDINHDINAKVFINANDEKLYYKIDSNQMIKNTAYTIKLLQMPPEVHYWVLDAIKMDGAYLNEAFGWIAYDKLEDAYKSIYANATLEKLDYRYHPELEAVHSKRTVLEFKDGVLYIVPQNPSSYAQDLGTSHLKIDFTQQDELLSLSLVFDGILNSDMLKILNTYKIKLPLVQKNGFVSTNLQIDVNLRTIDTNAAGDFYTKGSNFDYLGLNIDVDDAYVKLDNYNVVIKNMSAHYKNHAKAQVTMEYDANLSVGMINMDFTEVIFDDLNLTLNQQKPLNVQYHIAPESDFIEINKSSWKQALQNITIDAIHLPFDLVTMQANLPTTQVVLKDMASMYLDGLIDIKNESAALNIDLLSLSYKDIKLAQSSAQLQFKYLQNAQLTSHDKILLAVNNTDVLLHNFDIELNTEKAKINSALIAFDDMLEVNLRGQYRFNDQKSSLVVENIHFLDEKMQEMLHLDEKFQFTLDIDNEKNLKVNSKELQSTFALSDAKWVLQIDSILNIKPYSSLLQKYEIIDANATISKEADSDLIFFDTNITQPHAILLKDGIPTQEYFVAGTYNINNQKTQLNINKDVDVFVGNRIKIKMNNCGINVDAIVDMMDNNDSSNETKDNINLVLNAKNSYLYLSENRRIISDTIDLQYLGNITTAQLIHDKGSAGFRLSDDAFHLYGHDFGSVFMENLFALSKFKEGTLDFSMSGSLEDYDGIFYVKDTTILEYKILNNVLAFINTIPSFITFSMPSYSTNGLYAKTAYMGFKAKDDVFYINDLYLDSHELDIFGRGVASIKTNSIDLKLNLKTDLGSSASKIPIVGYLLFDEGSVSTSLNVTGELSDPDVDSLLPSEIIVAPLNIIKRTFLLPQHLWEDDEQNRSEEQNTSEE